MFSIGEISADLQHKVKKGQTLSAIAIRYGIKASALASANRISKTDTLRIGQVLQIPEEGIVYVQKGETLSKIARTHHVSMKELAELNGIKTTSLLQIGQRLMLPGHEISKVSKRAKRKWGRPRRRGVVTLVRLAPKERARMRLVSRGGKVRKAAIRRLRRMLRHRQTGKKRKPHPRLLRLLTRVSDHFGGREIQLISGYRPPGGHTKRTSRHTKGNAIDLRVKGVSNKELIRYLRRFKRVGVGYYPRSTFVHMDIRNKSAYWVDWSRPGQAPIYTKPGIGPPEQLAELDQKFDAKKEGSSSKDEAQEQKSDRSSKKEDGRLSVREKQTTSKTSKIASLEKTKAASPSENQPSESSKKESTAKQEKESKATLTPKSEKNVNLKTVKKSFSGKDEEGASSKSAHQSSKKGDSDDPKKEVVKKENPASTKKEDKDKQAPPEKNSPAKKEMANREDNTNKSSSHRPSSKNSMKQTNSGLKNTDHQAS